MTNVNPTPQQLPDLIDDEPDEVLTLAEARANLARFQKKQARHARIESIPRWEHFVLFIIAITMLTYVRFLGENPIQWLVILVAGVTGLIAIFRPVLIAAYHFDKSALKQRAKTGVRKAELDVARLEAEEAAALTP
jgi:Flp pilus assembly protein TadB